MVDRQNVMISSTVVDLPVHRAELRDACLRVGMFPLMMEQLPASDADAIAKSLSMVDEVDIYVGMFGYRYGHVPQGYDRSISEMEVDRAIERDIPRCIFFMAEDHSVTRKDVDIGLSGERLERLKERLARTHIVLRFSSPADLRAQVIHSLNELRVQGSARPHSASGMPTAPTPYIAHPYTLLETKSIIGRQRELNLLTDWVAKPGSEIYQARVLTLVAIGGMGKSALTWRWFNDIAPQEMQRLAGCLWWSFYEENAGFESFLIHALCYATGRAKDEVELLSAAERESQLRQALDRRPFLFVLDGFERLLLAYARLDAAYLADDEVDEPSTNFFADALGLASNPALSSSGRHRMRKTIDPHVGEFLRRLTAVRASRILISSRLLPADLQTATNESVPGSFAHPLSGLTDDDALALWRAFGVRGSRNELVKLSRTFKNYPLLIRALAGEVARDRQSPGDFLQWLTAHPDFDPFSLPIVQRRSHVLAFALHGLTPSLAQILQLVAACRTPVEFDTLMSLLVGPDKYFPDDSTLDLALTELEDRGLIGWDRKSNRYDEHPVVRGVIWSRLDHDAKHHIYQRLHEHFASRVGGEDEGRVLTDLPPEFLTVAIEHYNALVGLEQYGNAITLLANPLVPLTLLIGSWRQTGELIEMLFDTSHGLERLDLRYQADAYAALGLCTHFNGEPARVAMALRHANALAESAGDMESVVDHSFLLAMALCDIGALTDAQAIARRAFDLQHSLTLDQWSRGLSHLGLGVVFSVRGMLGEARILLDIAATLLGDTGRAIVMPEIHLARCALWEGDYHTARSLADNAWERAIKSRGQLNVVQAATLQGAAAQRLGDSAGAHQLLRNALLLARTANLAGAEMPIMIELAEWHRREAEPEAARALLKDLQDAAERGPYQLYQADGMNVLAEIERNQGNRDAAIAAATAAFRLAWCDGPTFAYRYGLENARTHLAAVHVDEPTDLPPSPADSDDWKPTLPSGDP
jgi:tetratricopeptide (TPR) repeat protein